MSQAINDIIGIIVAGSFYSLVSAGFVILFRATKVLSFAQGAYMLLGATVFYSMVKTGMPLVAAAVVAVLLVAAAGALTYQTVFRRAVGLEPFALSVATIGVATAFQTATLLGWGANPLVLPTQSPTAPAFHLGSTVVTIGELVTFVVSIAAMAGLAVWIRKSRTGLRMRAVADSQFVAMYSGINVRRVATVAWGIAAATAAITAVLYGLVNGIDPPSIPDIGLFVFPAAIIGGLDSVPGSVAGGYVLGIIYTVVGSQVGGQYQTPAVYGALVLLILVKPRGLFGSAAVERI